MSPSSVAFSLMPDNVIFCIQCSDIHTLIVIYALIFWGATACELVVVFSLEMPSESEKAVMEQFFQKDSMVRQSQVRMHPFTPILRLSVLEKS